jgi:chromosome partitioning protein
LQELQKKYKVIGVIKKLAIAKKGIYDGQSVIEQNPSSELAVEYMKIADIICGSEV